MLCIRWIITPACRMMPPFVNSTLCTIPYRELIHKNLKKIRTAGNTFSSDGHARGAACVIPSSMAMGQAADFASALTVQKDCAVCEVDYTALKAPLLAQGADLGE